MSSLRSLDELSSGQFQAMHDACEEFERALRERNAVSIAVLLEDVDDEMREVMFAELLAIELDWRFARGEQPTLDEYRCRFECYRDTSQRVYQEIENEAILRLGESCRSASADRLAENPLSRRGSPIRARFDHVLSPRPNQIGRYQIDELLGSGAFGAVYRARDPVLERVVAIKVPHPELTERTKDVRAYFDEARTLAGLSHPHIVPLYDVGASETCPCFFVLAYIEGETLASRIQRGRLPPDAAANLIATIAEALHFAHQKRITHRDVKPANILIASDGKPYLMDFGLALFADDIGKGPRYAGTAAYMSPEQARGEGHRVDRRSDIFSLGVVLYELLAGRRPFRGDTQTELLRQVSACEPWALRHWDATVPHELERICQRAMAKRAADRYPAADDFAQDLRQFMASRTSREHEPRRGQADSREWCDASIHPLAGAAELQLPEMRVATDSRPIRIVPKGLRAFDEQDAEFFIDLLPGVRDQHGVPENLRFWKAKIEQLDADQTFAVGLLYGPSGCGKSSLVRAGVVPRLSRNIVPIFIEASADDTEAALLRRLRSRYPQLPGEFDLKQSLRALRTGDVGGIASKTLIVLDQFEQWLHAHPRHADTQLVDALRQCDGSHVQCLVMVRDDFWMAATCFMHELEFSLLDGINARSVDLLSAPCAERILTAIGQAFGHLPDDNRQLTAEQRRFVKDSIQGLSDQGSVMCVRLALYAQMMKHKPWTPATLSLLGGTIGVGVTFLEDTFCSTKAPLENRFHLSAAQKLLHALLPGLGSDIKGCMRSYRELLAATGYTDRRKDFDELLRILDGELRLITPTERSEDTAPPASTPNQQTDPPDRYYQLSHDYLVPALRDWLGQKQKETRHGRAALRLADYASLWSTKRENHLLPTLADYLIIRMLTRRSRWTAAESRMMSQAKRVLSVRWASILAVLILLGLSVHRAVTYAQRESLAAQTRTAVDALEHARGNFVPTALAHLSELPRPAVVAEVERRYRVATSADQKLALGFALAELGQADLPFLISRIRSEAVGEVANLYVALSHQHEEALEEIAHAITIAQKDASPQDVARLSIVAMHLGEPSFAYRICIDAPDPELQTHFLLEFPQWHGALAPLATLNAPSSSESAPAWRRMISLALGSVPAEQVGPEGMRAWTPILEDWCLHQLDTGTHSAATWAINRWQQTLPPIPASRSLNDERQWYRNDLGMTLLKIPAGAFVRRDTFAQEPRTQTVTISRPYLIGDSEVSVGQFLQFIHDKSYDESERPLGWQRERADICPTDEHPIHEISWYDAIMFCNWLSRREGLMPCYERTDTEDLTERRGLRAWHWNPSANGYRLPTEAEWEYACRAGTSTTYWIGDDVKHLRHFTVFGSATAEKCAHHMPNRWGLFAMSGNMYEWCQDWSAPYDNAAEVVDPIDLQSGGMRVMRGGMYGDPAERCGSTYRNRSGPWGRGFCGLRVARSLPLE